MRKTSPCARTGRRAPNQPHLQEVNRWRCWAEARKDEAIGLAQDHLRACRRCRECRGEVNFTETICPHCGASDPVRVPMSVPTVLGVAMVVVLCGLVWVL